MFAALRHRPWLADILHIGSDKEKENRGPQKCLNLEVIYIDSCVSNSTNITRKRRGEDTAPVLCSQMLIFYQMSADDKSRCVFSCCVLPVGCHVWTRSCCCCATMRKSSGTCRLCCAPLSPSRCRLASSGYGWSTGTIPWLGEEGNGDALSSLPLKNLLAWSC